MTAVVRRVYSVSETPEQPLANPDRSQVDPTPRRPRMIDVRCSALAPGRPATTPAPTRQCQLFAGHEGEHAVMYCRHGHRTVRTWATDDPQSMHEHVAGQESLPWVPGMPSPAWNENA